MATNALSDPTAAGQSGLPYVGAAANDGNGDDLRTAITYINDLLKDIHGSQNASNVVQTPFVDGDNVKTDAIEHKHLEDRYTAKVETNHATGAYSLDWSTGSVWEFTATLTGNIELDFTEFKQGQVIDIYGLTGSYTITLDSDAATTETFNKVGGVDYDGASSNHLQVICVDDSDDAVFNYSIATYESDTTPS